MNIVKALGIATALLIIVASGSSVQAQKKTPKFTNVTSTIAITDANNVLYSIQGDGQGVYVNGAGSVTSQIQPIGDWELDMFSSTTRKAFITLDNPISYDPVTQPRPSNGLYATRFLTQCSNYGTGLPAMLPGNTYKCGLIVGFNTGSERYTMRFYTKNLPAVGSEDATVTCTAADAAGKCNAWRIQSLGADNSSMLKARLFKVVESKRGLSYIDYGLYALSFDASLTNP